MALNYLGKISNGSLLILVTVRVQSIHFLVAREPTSKKVALDNSSKSQVSTESSGRATVSNLNPFSLELCRATSKLFFVVDVPNKSLDAWRNRGDRASHHRSS